MAVVQTADIRIDLIRDPVNCRQPVFVRCLVRASACLSTLRAVRSSLPCFVPCTFCACSRLPVSAISRTVRPRAALSRTLPASYSAHHNRRT